MPGYARAGASVVARSLARGLVGACCSSHRPLRTQGRAARSCQGALRVDGLAAVVGGLAPGKGVISIYRSDVELRARLSLLRAGGDAAALGPLPASLLGASLDELVGEALVASRRHASAWPSRVADQVQSERQRLSLGVGGEAQLQSFTRALGVAEGELSRIAERKAVVSGFLAANLEGTLEVSASELEKAYAEQEHPFGGPALRRGARPAARLADPASCGGRRRALGREPAPAHAHAPPRELLSCSRARASRSLVVDDAIGRVVEVEVIVVAGIAGAQQHVEDVGAFGDLAREVVQEVGVGLLRARGIPVACRCAREARRVAWARAWRRPGSCAAPAQSRSPRCRWRCRARVH